MENADLGLKVEAGIPAGSAGGGVEVAQVKEVFVQSLDFDGGSGLVQGRLRERIEGGCEHAERGREEQGSLAAPEGAPIVEQRTRWMSVGCEIGGVGSLGRRQLSSMGLQGLT